MVGQHGALSVCTFLYVLSCVEMMLMLPLLLLLSSSPPSPLLLRLLLSFSIIFQFVVVVVVILVAIFFGFGLLYIALLSFASFRFCLTFNFYLSIYVLLNRRFAITACTLLWTKSCIQWAI